MERMPFEYRRCARRAEIAELAREIAPMEVAGMKPREIASVGGMLMAAAAKCRTYVVRLGGRLCGICFVEDREDRREMAFTKTRHLVEDRKVAFARGIPQLLADLAAHEAEAGRDAKPMYMHAPDARSREWFVRAGCAETERGLLCPRANAGRPQGRKEA